MLLDAMICINSITPEEDYIQSVTSHACMYSGQWIWNYPIPS